MIKFKPNKFLGSKLIYLSVITFLIFLLIAAITLPVNTQNPYTSSNLPELFNTSNFLYELLSFSYRNYTLGSNWLSSMSSFNSSGRYSVPFSQPDYTYYSFQPMQNWSSGVNSVVFSQSLFSSYQNPFSSFKYQSSLMQDWGTRNSNTSSTSSYIRAAMGDIPSVFSIGSYPTANYLGYSYPSNYYQGYNYSSISYPTTYYPGYVYPWGPASTGFQQQQGEVIGTIGMITDLHYADKNSTDRRFRDSRSGPRFYSEAGDDLADFVKKMNSMAVDAAIELGDFIDIHSGNSIAEGNSNTHDDGDHGEEILFEAESIYSKLNMPRYHVMGNWDMYDYDFATPNEWFKYIINGIPATIESLGGDIYTDAIGNPVSRYYSFKFGSVLGIVLDSTSGSSSGDNYPVNTVTIGYVPQAQLNWLKDVLANNRAGKNMPVIVFIHPFLYPIFTGDDHYMCKNHSSVRSILEADKNVIAVFNGHHHPGARGWWEDTKDNPYSNVYHSATGGFGVKYNGIKYYNLRGSIIGWGSNSAGPVQKPSNVYYVLTVKKGVSVSIEVRSFRTN